MSSLPRVGDDERFIGQALDQARAAIEHGDVPIGALALGAGPVASGAAVDARVERETFDFGA